MKLTKKRTVLENLDRNWDALHPDEQVEITNQLTETAKTMLWKKQAFDRAKWVSKLPPKTKKVKKTK